jgi:hypothetical protein
VEVRLGVAVNDCDQEGSVLGDERVKSRTLIWAAEVYWVDGGITPEEAGTFAGKLSDIGFDYVCVSSGGISPAARPVIAPGY